jgi:Clr5 domain
MLKSRLAGPANPPSSSDWKRYQKIISAKYVAERKKLRDVRQEMLSQYGFSIVSIICFLGFVSWDCGVRYLLFKPKMYKYRINEWGVCK